VRSPFGGFDVIFDGKSFEYMSKEISSLHPSPLSLWRHLGIKFLGHDLEMPTNPMNYEYTEGLSTKGQTKTFEVQGLGRVVLVLVNTLNQSLTVVFVVALVCAFEKCLTGGSVMLGVAPPVHIFPLRLALGFHLLDDLLHHLGLFFGLHLLVQPLDLLL